MSLYAVRIGAARGWTEFVQSLTRAEEYIFNVLICGVILVVLWFQRDHAIAGTSLPLATLALPGVVGMLLAFNATTGGAFVVAFEREDGTLLRARTVPHGIIGYLTGQAVRIPLNLAMCVLYILIPGLFLFDGLTGTNWLTFIWVFVLGLLATLPLSMALGALSSNPRVAAQWLGLLGAGLAAISGIFYPITAMAAWLQSIAQVFPYYWLGLGMRSAMLPDEAKAVELDGSWRHLETVLVLGAWAVIGLLLAPVLLRRMARRESGARMQAGREKAAQRIG